MTNKFISHYRKDVEIRASLDAIQKHIVFNSRNSPPSTDDFFLAFVRSASRALYHSANAWQKFAESVRRHEEFSRLCPIPDSTEPSDVFVSTPDDESKFDIEAFFVASRSLFENNLRGLANNQRLGRSFGDRPLTLQEIQGQLDIAFVEFKTKTGNLRNHITHINSELKDIGVAAMIAVRSSGTLEITLPEIYRDPDGEGIDLAKVFCDTQPVIQRLIVRVRDICLDAFFARNGVPSHGYYFNRETPYGTLVYGIRSDGLLLNWSES